PPKVGVEPLARGVEVPPPLERDRVKVPVIRERVLMAGIDGFLVPRWVVRSDRDPLRPLRRFGLRGELDQHLERVPDRPEAAPLEHSSERRVTLRWKRADERPRL